MLPQDKVLGAVVVVTETAAKFYPMSTCERHPCVIFTYLQRTLPLSEETRHGRLLRSTDVGTPLFPGNHTRECLIRRVQQRGAITTTHSHTHILARTRTDTTTIYIITQRIQGTYAFQPSTFCTCTSIWRPLHMVFHS
jgi:hypothetical protein